MAFKNGHALIIGVGTYRHMPAANVPITTTDAQKVRDALCDETLCGYPQDQVLFLHDETATRSEILSALDKLAADVGEQNTVLIFYAGHGEYGADGNYYLTTHDTQLFGGKIAKGSGVSEIDLLEKLRSIKAKRMLLLVNACHSGEISPNLSNAPGFSFGDTSLPAKSAEALLSAGEGRVIITAARPNQKSWIGRGEVTIFTHALLEGLRGEGYVPNNAGYISLFGLYEHLYTAVKETADVQVRQVQEPELTILRGVGPFPVALYRGATDLGAFDGAESLPTSTAIRQVEKARSERVFQQLIRNVKASGDSSVAIGGDVSGSSITTSTDNSQRTIFDHRNQRVTYYQSAGNINFDSVQDRQGTGIEARKLPDRISTQYINDVYRRGSILSFGDPASWTVSNNNEGIVTLDQIWTPLRVADSQTRVGKVGTHENMAEADDGTDLRELFYSTDQALLILGNPGSGKSTSLAMFAVENARNWLRDKSNPLPIWVNLAAVTSGNKVDPIDLLLSGVPEAGIAVTKFGVEGGIELSRFLYDMIISGKALLLLDGLDEVKEHHLTGVRGAISHVLGLANSTRVITACRTFDYRQTAPSRKIHIERELELLPYSRAEQRLYVRRWYDAAIRIGRFSADQAEELKSALISELVSEEIAELAESPLLLALLTLIHSEEAKLPDTRAVVCDRAITYMLADSAKWRVREAGSGTLASPPVLSLAVEVAYRTHLMEEDSDGNVSPGVNVEMVDVLASQICDVMARADPTKNAPSPTALAQRLLKSHGLLLDSGNGQYKFAHRSFQEFLAGQYYAAGAHHEEAVSRGASIHWREPFHLMASFAGHEGENIYYILTLIEALLSVESAASVSSIQLGAEMLTEIGRRRLALRKFHSVLQENPEAKGTQGLWARARAKVSGHVENSILSLPERERSAAVLGLLGDPRFISNSEPVGPWTNLINVPAGTATIGSSRLDEHMLSTSGGFLGGVRKVRFEPLRIGRYPVTNAEFRGFVESDGYANMTYWQGKLASGWVSGDREVLELIRSHWISTLYEHHAKEIRDGEIDPGAIEEESIRRTAPRREPYYWLDRRFNQPNQPVVGINWWEASAFCAWATHKGHQTGKLDADQVISLPTEFEWEYASRPEDDDRIYPWGDEWSEEKAHVSTNILNMRQPAPVGIYLEPWPGAPCDLAGNVWEWTASLHLPYLEECDTQRLSPDSLEERVVRGSSWYNSSLVAACSARAVDRSYNLFYDVGFRVVSLHRDLERACTS